MDEQPGGPVVGGELRTSIWPAIHPRILELIREPPQHDRLHQQPPPRGAARPAPQRARRRGAGPRPPREHRQGAAPRDRGGAQGRPPPRPGRDEQPRARHRHGRRRPRDPGREPHLRRARACSGSAAPGHQVGEPSKGVIFPKYRGDLLETAVVVKGMHDGLDRADGPAAQPARRPRPADRRDDDRRAVHRRRAARARPPRRAVRDAHARGPRGRPRHAGRRLPERRVRRAQAADRLGPADGHGRRAAGRARRRRHERRHDPRPRPVPGLPRGRARHDRAGGSASSTRRWSTSCAPACTATS